MNRVLSQAGPHGPLFHDDQWRRKRAGSQHQREVIRLLQRGAAELDLSPLVDLAPDDRWRSLDPSIEDNGHEVPDVPAGLTSEDPAAGTSQGKGHDRLV